MPGDRESRIRKSGDRLIEELRRLREKGSRWFEGKIQEQEETIRQLQDDEKEILKEMEAIRRGAHSDPWRIQTWLQEKREGLTTNIPFRCENLHATPIQRAHLIFIDGTNNDPFMGNVTEGDASPTNVYRLYRAVVQKDCNQYATYFAGVGSQQDDPNPIRVLFRQFGGKGADRIRDAAYMELVKAYHPGDRLFLFGFSRGAAIARMLANLIAREGIAEQGIARYIEMYAYVVSKGTEHPERFSEGQVLLLDRIELSGQRKAVDIEFMGLWDTVAAFGNPLNQYEPNKELTVPDIVRKTTHLLAIDENRQPFQPTLLAQSEDDDGRIKEIWFRGVHADIGGGYREHRLADVTLRFMRNRLEQDHGIRLNEPENDYDPDPLGAMHSHDRSRLPKLPRVVSVKDSHRKPCIHKSAFVRDDAVSERLKALRDSQQCEVEAQD
ncbi:phospholipase effector Tle1 domain-containing protein [Cupriavidus necator]